jgi:hypothetical protein
MKFFSIFVMDQAAAWTVPVSSLAGFSFYMPCYLPFHNNNYF